MGESEIKADLFQQFLILFFLKLIPKDRVMWTRYNPLFESSCGNFLNLFYKLVYQSWCQSWIQGLNNSSVPAMHRSFRTSTWIFQTNMNHSCFSSRQQNWGNSKNVHMAFMVSLRATQMTYSNVHISSGTGHSS